jgi:hypothetical protein
MTPEEKCPFDIPLHKEIWINGYKEGQKDSLTADNIRRIVKIIEEMIDDDILIELCGDPVTVYPEILRRFNESRVQL